MSSKRFKVGDLVTFNFIKASEVSIVGIVLEVKDVVDVSLFTGKKENNTVAYVAWSARKRNYISNHVTRALKKVSSINVF